MHTSVVICTYNPRPEFLARTLQSIAPQVENGSTRECVIVDNNSPQPVACEFSWVRIVREPRQGLTAARLRGVRETAGELIVFVDDDNVLAADYLDHAEAIARDWPQLGVFGGGTTPEFETPPPDWLAPFFSLLAIARCDSDAWSNQRDYRAFPIGAGMCIRRRFAERYAEEVAGDTSRASLGRAGSSLASGEDTDMVLTTLAAGGGTARFKRLTLTHLIPAARLDYGYNRRLAYATGYSAGKLARHYDGVTGVRCVAQAFRTIAYTLFGSHRGKARWIAAAGKYGYLRGLVGLKP
jgi:glycosyltransferase involved in cell wall biosynthesis